MTMEYGGYLPLELEDRGELFDSYSDAKVARFNSGRAAVVVAAKTICPGRLFIPRYNCEFVRDMLKKYDIAYEMYYLDENLEPKLDSLGTDDWMLYVNYFGLRSDDRIKALAEKYKNVIFDNTQAFFARPVLDGNCMNVYSPRKFVGLIDGGYLVWSGERTVSEDYPLDISWERGIFLLKSIELGTNAAYQDNLDSKVCLADGVKKMSVLTRKMLRSLNYADLEEKRARNYRCLAGQMADINTLELPTDGYAPFVYPLIVRKDGLRKRVVGSRIYAPQWWKYLLNEVPEDSVEASFSKWLLPLPIDQRYSEEDMLQMAKIVKTCCQEC